MKLKLAAIGIAAPFLAATFALLWVALDCPPPRLVREYGVFAQGRSTGRTKVISGMEFVEVAPGYVSCRRFQVDIPRTPKLTRRWVESPETIWIARDKTPRVWLDAYEFATHGIKERWRVSLSGKLAPRHRFPQWAGLTVGEAFRWATTEEVVCAFRQGILRGRETGTPGDRRPIWENLAAVNAGTDRQAELDCYLVGPGWHRLGAERVKELLLICWGGNTVPAISRLVWIPPEGRTEGVE